MGNLERSVRLGFVVATALFLGLLASSSGDSARAGQRATLAKLVDIETLPQDIGERAEWTHVVYLDRAAGPTMTRLMNDLHSVMADRGWRYTQMMPHMEDGDLKGIWLVYAERSR